MTAGCWIAASIPRNADIVYYPKYHPEQRVAHMYKVDLSTGERTLLVDSNDHWDPMRAIIRYGDTTRVVGFEASASDLTWFGHGAWVVAPMVVGDRLVFCANWSYLSSKESPSQPVFQLYVCDKETGENVEKIGFMNLGAADHPFLVQIGRTWFMTNENQGYKLRWGLWSMTTDGGAFAPEVSAMARNIGDTISPHRGAQLHAGVAWEDYYDRRMIGTIRVIGDRGRMGQFGPPHPKDNPAIRDGYFVNAEVEDGVVVRSHAIHAQLGFQPNGLFTATPWATSQDWDAATIDGEDVGEWGHPAPEPQYRGMLATRRTGIGHDTERNLGIYLLKKMPATDHSLEDVVKVIDDPDFAEIAPYPLLTWEQIYGKPAPVPTKYPRESDLPEGSPYARLYMGAMHYRESERVTGLPGQPNGLIHQGGDVVDFTEDEVEYLLVWATHQRPFIEDSLPSGRVDKGRGSGWSGTHHAKLYYGGWKNGPFERLSRFWITAPDGVRHPGIPLKKYRKSDGTVHYGPNPPEGAELILGPDGEPDTSVLADFPADVPIMFGLGDRHGRNLVVGQTWHHFRPRESTKSCIGGCHLHHGESPIVWDRTFAARKEYPRIKLASYDPVVEFNRDVRPILQRCLECHEGDAPRGELDLTNVANLVHRDGLQVLPFDNDRARPYMARRSTLYEMVASRTMPPASVEQLTQDEINTIGQWIDDGCLIAVGSTPHAYADTIPPTLHIASPARVNSAPVSEIKLGILDAGSGIDWSTLSVKLDGNELAGDLVWDEPREIGTLALAAPVAAGELDVSVRDQQPNLSGLGPAGNLIRMVRTFRTESEPTDPPDRDSLLARIAELERLVKQLEDQIQQQAMRMRTAIEEVIARLQQEL